MKLTTNKAHEIFTALTALDGYDAVVKDRVVKMPFKLDGRLRMQIAINLSRLQEVLAGFDKARVALAGSLANGASVVPPDKLPEFNKQLQQMLAEEYEIDLLPLSEDQLGLDANAISPSVLSKLLPLIGQTA